jgi:hypothetical protein
VVLGRIRALSATGSFSASAGRSATLLLAPQQV